METSFAPELLERPDFAASEKILRKCVHCGFCTATCPTFLLLGDENDSPARAHLPHQGHAWRTIGRPTAKRCKHVDRCLSCLSCMTTCPSGVNYMHLVDHARTYIEEDLPPTARRPACCASCSRSCCRDPALFRLALQGARFGQAPRAALPAQAPARRWSPWLRRRLPKASPSSARRRSIPRKASGAGRVALLTGCAQKVLDPAINEATIRVLTRHGSGGGGDRQASAAAERLPHHMGREHEAHRLAQGEHRSLARRGATRAASTPSSINTSGCGTTIKDYGFMFRDDPAWATRAAAVSGLAQDVSEVLVRAGRSSRAARSAGSTSPTIPPAPCSTGSG